MLKRGPVFSGETGHASLALLAPGQDEAAGAAVSCGGPAAESRRAGGKRRLFWPSASPIFGREVLGPRQMAKTTTSGNKRALLFFVLFFGWGRIH